MAAAEFTTTPFGPVRSLGRSRVAGAGGTMLAVEEWGDPKGRPVLLVHAWSQSRLGWLPQAAAPELQGLRLVAFDHRGHGDSGKPADIAAYADDRVWADDIAAVIADRKLEDLILVGWSMGGLAVLDHLKQHGADGVAGVVLVGHVHAAGVPEADALFGEAVHLHAADAMSDDLSRRIAGTLALVRALSVTDMPREEFDFILGTNMIVPTVAKAGMLSRRIDHAETLLGLAPPLMIVHGTADRIATIASAERARSFAPHAELHLYQDVAHAPAWEARERFNRDLARFAASAPRRRPAA